MIERQFGDAEGSETVGFSHSDFCFVVQTLDYAAGELFPGAKIVEDQFAVGPKVLATFFMGSIRERITWRHHWSRNLAAQVVDS